MLDSLRTLFGMKPKSAKKARKPARRSFRPMVDSLEDRRLMAVLFVDDNLQQFPAAPYTSIQAAVNAANPGDVIQVFAGKYNESVTIPAAKPRLTLIGASTGPTHALNPQLASIVDPAAGTGGVGFNVLANDTVIRGFTVGDVDDNTLQAVGIRTDATVSGFTIAGNVVTDNSIGLYPGSSGAKASYVTGNWVRGNNDGFLVAPAGGSGMYSDQGARNLYVTGNTITDQLNVAVNFAGLLGQQNNIRVEGNVIGEANRDDSGAAIVMINTTNSSVTGNAIFQSNTHGVTAEGGNVNLTVRGNSVQNASWTGINVNTVYSGPNLGTRIESNTVLYAGDSGIRLRGGATNSYVFNNTVQYSQGTGATGNGIAIEDSSNNVVQSNRTYFNNNNGILVTGVSTGNTIASNVSLFNATFDLNEVSVLFANFWYGNTAQTRSRPGL
jgi:hypothetical protein